MEAIRGKTTSEGIFLLMRDKLKRLDATKIRSLTLSTGHRELILKINEIVERINEIEDDLASIKGEKKWEVGSGR
ncbi:MAG: hypothetical protein FJ403_01920 [Verrucomicrobia bacterium]|nr:hypothetical protein [Verrucomicrobiota bacterium]